MEDANAQQTTRTSSPNKHYWRIIATVLVVMAIGLIVAIIFLSVLNGSSSDNSSQSSNQRDTDNTAADIGDDANNIANSTDMADYDSLQKRVQAIANDPSATDENLESDINEYLSGLTTQQPGDSNYIDAIYANLLLSDYYFATHDSQGATHLEDLINKLSPEYDNIDELTDDDELTGDKLEAVTLYTLALYNHYYESKDYDNARRLINILLYSLPDTIEMHYENWPVIKKGLEQEYNILYEEE